MSDALERSGGECELCGSNDGVEAVPVAPRPDAIAACATCRAQLAGTAPDASHWLCLQGSAWSEVPAVQVVAWRMLGRLDAGWALELRDQLWLDDDTLAWAKDAATGPAVVDCNGTPLADGDTVTLVKDLDVKGAGFTAKRGTVVKNIRLGDDPGLVEGRVNNTSIYLKTEFIKRA
ncbi:MAG: PhnA domain-containing protein [Alphaproteobacteria bacterium]|nr:PhnA domain-containing protein [Alphaproteobacteria bacterium]